VTIDVNATHPAQPPHGCDLLVIGSTRASV